MTERQAMDLLKPFSLTPYEWDGAVRRLMVMSALEAKNFLAGLAEGGRLDTQETKLHTHRIEHAPASGTGTAVCECGATVRVERGVPVEVWHTCELCTHEYGRLAEAGR